jgi:hypothetical protein
MTAYQHNMVTLFSEMVLLLKEPWGRRDSFMKIFAKTAELFSGKSEETLLLAFAQIFPAFYNDFMINRKKPCFIMQRCLENMLREVSGKKVKNDWTQFSVQLRRGISLIPCKPDLFKNSITQMSEELTVAAILKLKKMAKFEMAQQENLSKNYICECYALFSTQTNILASLLLSAVLNITRENYISTFDSLARLCSEIKNEPTRDVAEWLK